MDDSRSTVSVDRAVQTRVSCVCCESPKILTQLLHTQSRYSVLKFYLVGDKIILHLKPLTSSLRHKEFQDPHESLGVSQRNFRGRPLDVKLVQETPKGRESSNS